MPDGGKKRGKKEKSLMDARFARPGGFACPGGQMKTPRNSVLVYRMNGDDSRKSWFLLPAHNANDGRVGCKVKQLCPPFTTLRTLV
uniref:Uncharacterized protein n=1 Tax=Caenorhabditis tropicalis TaxID=1561998 RepID=A0A1I7TVP8_9PELO